MTTPDATVLLVEDEDSFVEALTVGLKREGFRVRTAHDGAEALELFDVVKPDLVLLDVMLPKISGVDVCRELRRRSTVPIIMVTAKGSEIDTVVGLEVGADDYVTKPFSVRELIGRVRAQLRRRELDRTTAPEASRIEAGAVHIDLARHLVTVRGEPVNLTRSEFQVLRLLAERPGQVFSRLEIMEELWQSEFRGDVRACDVHISNLRQKIERDPQEPELVLTVRGVGYKLAEDSTDG
jgi:two-component system, OmpR family, response regulator RegX3